MKSFFKGTLEGGCPPVPYYCEENVWKFLGQESFRNVRSWAVFVSNETRSVSFSLQKGSLPGEVLVWDYHAVALATDGVEWLVWDFNTELDIPCSAVLWLRASFGHGALPERYAPRFRVVPRDLFLGGFASDRGHMRRLDGSFSQPPPPWDPPGGGGSNLGGFVAMDGHGPGHVRSLAGMLRFVGASRLSPSSPSRRHS